MRLDFCFQEVPNDFDELRAERLSAAWVRLTAGDAEPRELETARREALQLEPAPGADWLGAHGA